MRTTVRAVDECEELDVWIILVILRGRILKDLFCTSFVCSEEKNEVAIVRYEYRYDGGAKELTKHNSEEAEEDVLS
jgi:hypothetical protein